MSFFLSSSFNTTYEPIHVSVIGLGFVGGAMLKSFREKGCNVVGYDKYKPEYSNTFEQCCETNISFLCLPTVFDEANHSYDKSCIIEICEKYSKKAYKGAIVIKSTVEPGTCNIISEMFPNLHIIHNPEFLTASTAYEDFHNQTHVVLGKGENTSEDKIERVSDFYKQYYPLAEISLCEAIESESMKIYVNCFYATKIQFFNELYALTNKTGGSYEVIRELMLKNNWINPMHTLVPGTDNKLSYGGGCFPKDTNALVSHMKRLDTPFLVLDAVIKERNLMRTDHTNVKLATNEEDNK